jgi:Flp pilus assembly protein TadD
LGRVLLLQGKPAQAVAALRQATALHYAPSDAVQLAMALVQQGRTQDAVAEYRNILASNPDLPDALNNLAWILAASTHPEFRNGANAVQLAQRACEVTHNGQPLMIGTLAAAYAEAGRFDDAVKAAQKAHDLAVAEGKSAVAARNLELQQLYRAHRAYHE